MRVAKVSSALIGGHSRTINSCRSARPRDSPQGRRAWPLFNGRPGSTRAISSTSKSKAYTTTGRYTETELLAAALEFMKRGTVPSYSWNHISWACGLATASQEPQRSRLKISRLEVTSSTLQIVTVSPWSHARSVEVVAKCACRSVSALLVRTIRSSMPFVLTAFSTRNEYPGSTWPRLSRIASSCWQALSIQTGRKRAASYLMDTASMASSWAKVPRMCCCFAMSPSSVDLSVYWVLMSTSCRRPRSDSWVPTRGKQAVGSLSPEPSAAPYQP
mmetsp:Transcript_21407/g.67172  ORF Transcript_21407/g.67172 Transcript_21407/m.67172 type:complete len:274 (-) Transcript_21407:3056-3877(-)